VTGNAPAEKAPGVEPSVEKAPTVAPSAVGGVPGGDPADGPALADPVSATAEPGIGAEAASPGVAADSSSPGVAGGGGAPIAGVEPAPTSQSLTDRPEVLVGAAFAGGVLLAIIFRRLGS
jgi:hypothetical protein